MPAEEIEPFPGQELTEEMHASVSVEELVAPGLEGAPDVRVLVYRPKVVTDTLPLIVSLHGGGFALRPDMFPAGDAGLAMLGAVVVAVDYRIVPEDPFPCATEDCYRAACWAIETLDVDPEQVVVTGVSAGGALAAALTLMARDRGGPKIKLQSLVIPVLDDRCESASMRQFPTAPLFGGNQAVSMWEAYLGPDADRSSTSPYAAPARAASLAGLPPAFIQVGELDPLRDEGIDYAKRLMAEGVSVELYCVPRMHHGLPEDMRAAAQGHQLMLAAIQSAIGSSTVEAASPTPGAPAGAR